jgi:hypothetical protein
LENTRGKEGEEIKIQKNRGKKEALVVIYRNYLRHCHKSSN